MFVFGVSRNLKWTGIGCTAILSTKLLFPEFSFLRQPHHHFLQACVSRHRLFLFPSTKSVLDSTITAHILGIPSAPDWPILLFCSVFSEQGCVTSQIRHSQFSAQIRKSALCISFLAALRTIRTKAVFVFFHGFCEKKRFSELFFAIHRLKYEKLQEINKNKDKRR